MERGMRMLGRIAKGYSLNHLEIFSLILLFGLWRELSMGAGDRIHVLCLVSGIWSGKSCHDWHDAYIFQLPITTYLYGE